MIRSLPSFASSLHAAKPNVLFLFADDFTYEAVGAFGHTDIGTPNLDRLAGRGSRGMSAWLKLSADLGDKVDLRKVFGE